MTDPDHLGNDALAPLEERQQQVEGAAPDGDRVTIGE
jgi:hypothetical protein